MSATAAAEAPIFDPYTIEFAENPYPFYKVLRDEAPVYYQPKYKFWALSRYEDVVKAHMDAKSYLSSGGVTIEAQEVGTPLLIIQDGKAHAVAKAMMTKLFAPARMAALDEFIRQKAIKYIEQTAEKAAGGEVNFVHEVTVQLPLEVIGELLGIPEEMRPKVHELSNNVVTRGELTDEELNQSRMELLGLYFQMLTEKRKNLGDDPISTLINAEVKDEDGNLHKMDDMTIALRFMELGFAGHETVAKAIPNGAMAMTKFPSEREKLAADMSLLDNTVAEILRYDPPSHLQGRTAARDIELHGVTIPEGDRVMLMTGAACRDERRFENPEVFDISREPDRHSISFGHGVHKCLGVHLARREITIFFEELFARYPDWQVFPERSERSVLANVRGVSALPIVFGKHA